MGSDELEEVSPRALDRVRKRKAREKGIEKKRTLAEDERRAEMDRTAAAAAVY